MLRDWTQAALLALLVPAWLAGEWEVRTEQFQISERLMLEGLLLLAITYLTARTSDHDSAARKALVWIGAISLLPLGTLAFVERHESWWSWTRVLQASTTLLVIGWTIAIAVPLAIAWALRKDRAWVNLVAAAWVLVIGTFHPANSGAGDSLASYAWNSLGIYVWAGAGALGLVAWGLLERQRDRINLGVAGFGLTVLIFYSSDVMDKLGRSASLFGMGVLLLFGGWILERTRRQLVARVQGNAA